ncbi:endolytic transglycosylase MltG [Salinibacterium sp. SWN1162]|uniref:endolytic transglycosylase MltG n=1 Tax=Salinibacterium sp. SWN1162 TaxID=2792053 RepID=UPI0018CCF583|nr:endolytic transglycosylase MltG [Salinibacterium sp. SWN1162]MBH0009278.1 endolytic transglycosylase MltG [Salinibacterium sp. SWN1162]
MADEPSWDEIFSDHAAAGAPKSARDAAAHGTDLPLESEVTPSSDTAESSGLSVEAASLPPAEASASSGDRPMTRREARAAQEASDAQRTAAAQLSAVTQAAREADALVTFEELTAGTALDSGGDDAGTGSSTSGGDGGREDPPRRKRRLGLIVGLPLLIIALLGAGVAAYGWINYEDNIREVLGWELENDFEGSGNGEEVVVAVNSGDIGLDIARSLNVAGVTMSFDAFYDLLLAQESDPAFFPGNYSLQKEMSAQSALDALLDPENKVTDRLLITEGTTLPDALEIISETTGIPLAEVQAASEDLEHFGLPSEAVSLEGYLFPATYDLDGGQDPYVVLDLMVDTMIEKLDAAGVAADDRYRILTMAALVQREAGPNTDDFYKISRVFYNRLDQDMLLQSDATVAYGTGNLHTVWTTDAERADASNPYNTYANPGLPVGPIGLPGELAIDSAINPADGDWLFFVPINLATGETVFTTNVDDHEAAAQQLRDWCAESDENGSYC